MFPGRLTGAGVAIVVAGTNEYEASDSDFYRDPFSLRLKISCMVLYLKIKKGEKISNAHKYEVLHKWTAEINEPNRARVPRSLG